MSISLREAKRLCTAKEFELVEMSTGGRATELSPAELKRSIARARKLRNKYRDLAERQHREAVGKQGPRGARPSQSNDRTLLKQQLFEETQARFEAQLGEVAGDEPQQEQQEPAREARRSPQAARAGGAYSQQMGMKRKPMHPIVGERRRSSALAGRWGKRTANPGEVAANDPVSPRNISLLSEAFTSRLPRKRLHFAESARQHIVGHVGAMTRHNQARRDSHND